MDGQGNKIDPNRLSEKEYWDEVLRDQKLPRVNSYKDTFIVVDFFDEILKKEGKKTLLEIGAGSSGWLPYFIQNYSLKVSGLDYSEIGCAIAEKNLQILQLPYDDIICADIFAWNSDKKYDVIFSYGVIEHFENPERILEICRKHLNEEGIIITLIPNLAGIMGWLTKTFLPEIFKIHKVIDRQELIRLHEHTGFKDMKSNYAGTFSLGVIPWIKSSHFLFANKVIGPVSVFFVYKLAAVLHHLFRIFKINIPSRRFSPYVISIMRKCN